MNKATKRKLEDAAFNSVGTAALAAYLRALALSVRFEWLDRRYFDQVSQSKRPVIYAFWHEDMISIALAYLRAKPGRLAVMVSRSRDGEKLARVIGRLGMDPVRASSSRGAVQGVVEMYRYLICTPPRGQLQRIAAIAMDGPRGPRREAKPGIALIARRASALVIPVAFAHSRQIVFKNWDQTRLPLPLSKSRILFGTPTDARDWPGDDNALADQLETRLNRLHAQLENGKMDNSHGH